MAATSNLDSSGNASSTMKAIAPLVAGFSGGTVGTILLMPLDNIKVRLQVNEGVATGGTPSSFSSSSPASGSRPRLGSIRMFHGVMKHEGIRGLYQGLVPAVIGSAVSWGGFFFVYEDLKSRLRHYKERNGTSSKILDGGDSVAAVQVTLNSWENFQVATLSGAVMVILTNPIWLVKTRMQLQMKKASEHMHVKTVQYDGFVDAIQKIVRQEGFWALYKGSGPAMLLTSHGGVQFVVYEFLRKQFHYARDKRDASVEQGAAKKGPSIRKRFEKSFGYLTMGAISKMVASTVTYPFQVMKSRMQQPSSSIELTSTGDVRVVKRDYTGMVATVRKIFQQEGLSGFFKGAIPNAVRVAPNAAVTFVIYEAVMDTLQ